jgi:hypothetical protein
MSILLQRENECVDMCSSVMLYLHLCFDLLGDRGYKTPSFDFKSLQTKQDNVSFNALYGDGSASLSVVQPAVLLNKAGFC